MSDLREHVRRNLHVNACTDTCRCEELTHVVMAAMRADRDKIREDEQRQVIGRLLAGKAVIFGKPAELTWPEGIPTTFTEQTLKDFGHHLPAATSGRCPSCDHALSHHQPDGCWFTVAVGKEGADLACQCTAPRLEAE